MAILKKKKKKKEKRVIFKSLIIIMWKVKKRRSKEYGFEGNGKLYNRRTVWVANKGIIYNK